MPIYPTEASWVSSTSPSPDPLYKDNHITVYGIPILASTKCVQDAPASTPEACTTPDLGLKRKREPSPDSPSKRPALATEESQQRPSLKDLMQQPDFSPASLTGETAQEWRRLMVDIMLPGVKAKMEAQKRKSQKGKERMGGSSPSKKANGTNAAPDSTDKSMVPEKDVATDSAGGSTQTSNVS